MCWSNCDAKAECGINADPVNTTCPLNVCCSEFGFCGTTSDFCGTGCQSNCDMPDGSGTGDGDVQKRIVAYYEAWKVDSSCAAVNLGMKTMPLGSLTHLIVSFGYITPDNYNIAAMPGVTLDKLGQFAKLKEDNPNTKIMISLGGWSFTDDDTDTQAVYTTMVGSHSNRATFITNLLAFLSQYGFDGVDFDWECKSWAGRDRRGQTKSPIRNQNADNQTPELRIAAVTTATPRATYSYCLSCASRRTLRAQTTLCLLQCQRRTTT